MRRVNLKYGAAALALALLAFSAAPIVAGETPEAAARALVEAATTARPGAEGLDAWSRSVLDRALGRAGALLSTSDAATPAAPLPAERQATTVRRGLQPGGAGPEVIVFASLSLPEASWRRWSLDAARAGAAFVLRGVAPGGLAATVRRLRARLPEGGAGVAIDPALFRRLHVDAVPAVAVVPGGAAPCRRRGCAGEPAPAHDRIAGNVGLATALEIVAAEGAAGRETARRHLARLKETRP